MKQEVKQMLTEYKTRMLQKQQNTKKPRVIKPGKPHLSYHQKLLTMTNTDMLPLCIIILIYLNKNTEKKRQIQISIKSVWSNGRVNEIDIVLI